MSEFVDECRREWRRLRVPDPIANEMAADLAADLAEAAAEGASAEQVLGSGAFDARAFAASWASERGVVRPAPDIQPAPNMQPAPDGRPAPPAGHAPTTTIAYPPVRRSRPPAVVAAVAILATLALAVTLISYRSGSSEASVVPASVRPQPTNPVPGLDFPGVHHQFANAAVPAIGLIVLLFGLAGLVLWILHWSPWSGPGRAWRRGPFDDGIGGPG